MGLPGGGGKPDIPAPAKVAPRRVEPDLDRARARRDIRRQQRSLATRPLGEPTLKKQTLGGA